MLAEESGQWHLNDTFPPRSAGECDSCISAAGERHSGVPLGQYIWRYASRGIWREVMITTAEVVRYRTVRAATLRSGKDSSTAKIGE
eukprot:COSAG01_NODE_32547_length_579_cov_1.060417_1_plen_86_part_10